MNFVGKHFSGPMKLKRKITTGANLDWSWNWVKWDGQKPWKLTLVSRATFNCDFYPGSRSPVAVISLKPSFLWDSFHADSRHKSQRIEPLGPIAAADLECSLSSISPGEHLLFTTFWRLIQFCWLNRDVATAGTEIECLIFKCETISARPPTSTAQGCGSFLSGVAYLFWEMKFVAV